MLAAPGECAFFDAAELKLPLAMTGPSGIRARALFLEDRARDVQEAKVSLPALAHDRNLAPYLAEGALVTLGSVTEGANALSVQWAGQGDQPRLFASSLLSR